MMTPADSVQTSTHEEPNGDNKYDSQNAVAAVDRVDSRYQLLPACPNDRSQLRAWIQRVFLLKPACHVSLSKIHEFEFWSCSSLGSWLLSATLRTSHDMSNTSSRNLQEDSNSEKEIDLEDNAE
jgi:hypothetical protein